MDERKFKVEQMFAESNISNSLLLTSIFAGRYLSYGHRPVRVIRFDDFVFHCN